MKITKIMSVIKSCYYNFKLFPFSIAIKFPLTVDNNCRIEADRGSIIFDCDISRSVLSIGNSGSKGIQSNTESGLFIEEGSKLILYGSAEFGSGSVIRIERNGILEIGNSFYSNKNCFVSVCTHCIIGSDVLLGWNVSLRDSDGHFVFKNNRQTNLDEPFLIGNHVWLGSYVDILKGAEIPEECIVAYRACVTNKFSETNTIIAGFPAKVVVRDVTWQR